MSDIAIKFENISKQYRLGLVGTGTISHDLNRWWYRVRGKEDPYLKIGEVNDRSEKAHSDYIWALRDITFDVKQGEVLGIIGKNGAGKSTLLKILSRVTSPTTGFIKAKGRIASLLEVGTGFHPEMTGRENIYMNGSIMGMTKAEITRKLDEIVAFAGVEKYIDTPVKRYSSGMTVRLGFAIAAHLEPEILVVDEVLAVGDAEFQKKAIGKMQDVSRGEGRTVLFVSHQLNSISSLCKQCVLLENGIVNTIGETSSVIARYLNLRDDSIHNSWIDHNNTYYNQHCTLKEFSLVDVQGNVVEDDFVKNNETIYIKFVFDIEIISSALGVGFTVFTERGEVLYYATHTDLPDAELPKMQMGENVLYAELPKRLLNEGNYIVKPQISLFNINWIIDPNRDDVPHLSLSIIGGLSDSSYWQERRDGILAPVIKFTEKI